MSERIPAEVFPPGEFLDDELAARGWTQTEFAEIIRRPTRVVNEVIAGRRRITPETARDIAAALGTSAELWMNLESAYQLSKVPPRDERVAREAALRERFPVRQMIKRGWIKAGKHIDELEEAVLAHFQLSHIEDENTILLMLLAETKKKTYPLFSTHGSSEFGSLRTRFACLTTRCRSFGTRSRN